MMKLSQRLETVASFVPEGSNVADIGTDHGYVPIYLVKNKIASRAIAMDVRTGPLKRAAEHVKDHCLEDKIEVRLSDGLKKLRPGEADCVVIAGMGGELMIRILEEGRHMWDTVPYWVLSPHSEPQKVRKYLREQSFSIERETMMKEEGKFYTVMGIAGYDPTRRPEAENRLADLYGGCLLRQNNPVLLEYLEKEHAKLEEIRTGLTNSSTEGARKRREELLSELRQNEEAQDEMQRNHRETGETGTTGTGL